jgi:hypothetical protein
MPEIKKPEELTADELEAVIRAGRVKADAAWAEFKQWVRPLLALRDKKRLQEEAKEYVKGLSPGQKAELLQVLSTPAPKPSARVEGAEAKQA